MHAGQLVQDGFDVRFDWGGAGVEALGPHCAVLVVVDVLSFGTTVDVAIGRGARVRLTPAQPGEPYWNRRPSAMTELAAGTELAMGSPNGGALCLRAAAHARVVAGCLRNAESVAQAAGALADGGPIGVIAAGEQWGVDLGSTNSEGMLRPALEDQLGAGAIVSALLKIGYGQASPEAALAATTYRAAEPYLGDLLAGCASGRELTDAGHGADVDLAAAVGASDLAPVLVRDTFRNAFEER